MNTEINTRNKKLLFAALAPTVARTVRHIKKYPHGAPEFSVYYFPKSTTDIPHDKGHVTYAYMYMYIVR